MYKYLCKIVLERHLTDGVIMEKYLFATGTVTHAVRGRDILRKSGIQAYVERSFAADRIGCGYGIIAVGNKQNIAEKLSSAGIKVLDVKRL